MIFTCLSVKKMHLRFPKISYFQIYAWKTQIILLFQQRGSKPMGETTGSLASMYTILAKVLGHPLLMKCLTTLVISMSMNLNV